MDISKGLQLDINPVYAEGWLHAKNITVSKKFNSVSNEDGTLEIQQLTKEYVGKITTNKETVIFSGDGDNMEIGILSLDNTYTKILDTIHYSLNKTNPIRGVYRYNNKHELEVAWVNGVKDNYNPPMFLNLHTATEFLNLDANKEFNTPSNDANKILMFPGRYSPILDAAHSNNGMLSRGQYFFAIQYIIDEERNEYTNPTNIEGPYYVGNNKDVNDFYIPAQKEGDLTGISLQITLTGLNNVKYKRFKLLVIKNINSVVTASVAATYTITGANQTIFYRGQIQETVPLESITVPNFSCVGADDITQTSKRIALSDIKTQVALNYQKYANNIKLEWVTKNATYSNERQTNRNISYMPDSIMAFYIVLEFIDGTDSKAFLITSHHSNNTGLNGDFKKFQSSEVLPNTEDWEIWDDTGSIGSLKNTNINYHRFPDYDTLYTNGATINKVLGIQAKDIFIPVEWRDKISTFKIGFAKRDEKSIFNIAEGICYADTYDTDIVGSSQNSDYGRFYSQDVLANKVAIPNNAKIKLLYEQTERVWGNAIGLAATGRSLVSIYNTPSNASIKTIINSSYIPKDYLLNSPINNEHREEYLQLNAVDIADHPVTGIAKYHDGLSNDLKDSVKIIGTLGITRIFTDPPSNIYEPFINQNIVNLKPIKYISSSNVNGNNTGEIYNGDGNLALNYLATVFDDWVDNSIYQCYRLGAYYYALNHPDDRIYDDVLPVSWNTRDINFHFQEWKFNKSFSLNDIKKYIPFDTYKNTINDNFPNRVHLGTKYFKDIANNSWRTFLPLDYYETSANRGKIESIHGTERDLLIQHTDSLYKTSVKDRVSSDQSAAYLRETDIFETSANEILDINGGYIGGQSKYASLITKLGYITIDISQGKVFIYSDSSGVNEISNGACRNWIRKNLGTGIVNKNPLLNDGITLNYDEDFNRLLITKNKENSSFTLSYSFDYNVWIAFHDYIPEDYFNVRNSLYSIKNNTIHKMNNNLTKATYYGTKFESFVDVVFNKEHLQKEYLQNIILNTEVVDILNAKKYDETATKILIYNNHQCSGYIDLKSNRFITYRNSIKGLYSINEFRDLVINSNDAIINPDFTLNTNNIDLNKAWYKKGRFTQDYIAIRIIYDNIDNKDFYLNAVAINQNIIR